MNNKKVLSSAILLLLAKSALGIEVEPNNDSKTANPLGLENVGQLSNGSDVDFFSITNSCITYTADDHTADPTHIVGMCTSYTAADQIADPANIEGEDKYRSEISLAFSCNSRAAVGTGGWYLGIHDSRGILQATYDVKPTDCMTGASGSAGPYSFKFPSLRDVPTYYVSVVADCHLPIYNTSLDPLNPVISANRFVQSTPATQTDIDAAQVEITKAQTALKLAITALNTATFSMIGSNDSIAKANDAISMAQDIVNQSKPNLTAATSINAVSSTTKAVGIMANAMLVSIQRHQIFNDSDTAVKAAAANVTAELAKSAPSDTEVTRLKTIKTNADDTKNSAATDDSDATAKLGEANTALANAVAILNTTVNTDTVAANAATDAGTRTNNTCTVSNNATYTITDTQISKPYENIAGKTPVPLQLTTDHSQRTAQIGSFNEVNFVQVAPSVDNVEIPLTFSCSQNSTSGSKYGWFVSLWAHSNNLPTDTKGWSYEIVPTDCTAPNTISLTIPKNETTTSIDSYYVGVQTACALAPLDSSSILEDRYAGTITPCDVNTTNYTLTLDTINPPLVVANAKQIQTSTKELNTPQKIDTAITQNLYYVDSTNSKNDIPLIFSCPSAKPFTNDWKLSIYNDSKVLLSSQIINGSSCRDDSDTGVYKLTLPSGSSRYYLSVASTCASADDKTCQLDTSEYTISRDVAAKQTKLDTGLLKTAITLGTDKTGQINSITDNDVYVIESTSAPEIPLIFSCTPMAVRKANDWTLSIYDDSNELVSSQVINGSDCGSGFKADKGGYKFKLLSADSTRYYLSVKSTCTTTTCVVDTSNYNIARDVTKIYTGVLATTKSITAKTANFKLTNCGSSPNATIAVKAENVNLSKKLSPINIQIGDMACQTAVPTVANSLTGTVVNPSTIFDSTLPAKDNATVALGDCGAAKGKVTLTGTGLDLENLNFDNAPDVVSIPVKVDMGDFHCSGEDIFYLTINDTGDTSYTNSVPPVNVPVVTPPTPVDTTPVVVVPPPVVIVDPITTALTTAKNIGVSQTNQLKSVTDIQTYYVDIGSSQADVNFTFSCPNSTRFTNDWTLSIYDTTKNLIGTPKIINGSDCGIGKTGDNGAFLFTISKNSPRSYMVIQSACNTGDPTCTVDSSPYLITRVTAAQAAASTPCFGTSCGTTTKVKPFFN